MAIITEEPDQPTPPPKLHTPPHPKTPSNLTSTKNTANPFHFWFYFTLLVSLTTLFFIFLSSFSPQDPKSRFLSLPPNLRRHYSNGRTIKVQTAPNHPQVEVFSIQEGSSKSSDRVLIVHGLGCSAFAFRKIVELLGQRGVYAVAIDLPGSGFSEKSIVLEEESVGFGRVWDVYSEIREKGLFWGFDQLVEKGYVDFDGSDVPKRKSVKAIELSAEEMGKVLGQVVETMGLAPVDLVLHDSALSLSANWVSENPSMVRSVTILDSESSSTALPLWVFQVPVIREVVLHSGFLFKRILEKYCSRSLSKSDAEAHRVLLMGRDGRRSVVGMGKRLNYSFDLAEWSSSDGVKAMPMQVIWSTGLSKEWSEMGNHVAASLPQAKFVTHSGGRWPQEQSADEVAESMYCFVSSLPKSVRQAEEEPIPEHIQKMLDEAQNTGHDHHHHHHHHGHGHEHHDGHGHEHHDGHGHEHHDGHGHAHAGYMDAYGLGHGWGM